MLIIYNSLFHLTPIKTKRMCQLETDLQHNEKKFCATAKYPGCLSINTKMPQCSYCTKPECRGLPKNCPGCGGRFCWTYIPPSPCNEGTISCYKVSCPFWTGTGIVYKFHPKLQTQNPLCF